MIGWGFERVWDWKLEVGGLKVEGRGYLGILGGREGCWIWEAIRQNCTRSPDISRTVYFDADDNKGTL